LRAQRQQEEEQQQDFDELPDFQVPKFKPFTPQNALQRAMTSFRFWHEDSGGQTLLVTPLTNEHIKGTADLLTDSFAEAMSATVYKNYLRRQVKQYLDAHVLLPPKAVVLIALLLPPPNASYTDQQQQQQDGSQDSAASGIGIGSSSSSSSSSGEAADVQPSIASPPAGDQQPAVGRGTQPALDSMASSSGSSSSSTEDEALGALSVSGSQLVGVVELSFSASTRSKYLTLTPPEVSEWWHTRTACSRMLRCSAALMPPCCCTVREVGSHIASRWLLLALPSLARPLPSLPACLPQDRPYLCNMAIDPQQRNRGYGTALLQAAETLVSQLGESEIYLHLRRAAVNYMACNHVASVYVAACTASCLGCLVPGTVLVAAQSQSPSSRQQQQEEHSTCPMDGYAAFHPAHAVPSPLPVCAGSRTCRPLSCTKRRDMRRWRQTPSSFACWPSTSGA
jgi:hypothetical protein